MRRKGKTVLVGGVFDALHEGHLFFFRKAKRYGDFLAVAVANDETARKKRRSARSAGERKKGVEMTGLADLVVIGSRKNLWKTVERVKPDIIVYGYDQEIVLKPKGVRIVKLRTAYKPEKFKSSLILKKKGKKRMNGKCDKGECKR